MEHIYTTLEARLYERFEAGCFTAPEASRVDVIDFIRQEIALDRATRDRELRERIENLKRPYKALCENTTLDDVLALLAESSK